MNAHFVSRVCHFWLPLRCVCTLAVRVAMTPTLITLSFHFGGDATLSAQRIDRDTAQRPQERRGAANRMWKRRALG